MKQNIIIFSQNRDSAGSWKFFSWKRRAHQSFAFNTVAADDSAMQGTKALAAMVWTYFSRNIPVTAPEGLNCWHEFELWPGFTCTTCYQVFSIESTPMLLIWHCSIFPTYRNYGVKILNTNVMLEPINWSYNLRDGSHAEQSKVKITPCGLTTYSYKLKKCSLPSHIKELNSLLEFKSLSFEWRDVGMTVVNIGRNESLFGGFVS